MGKQRRTVADVEKQYKAQLEAAREAFDSLKSARAAEVKALRDRIAELQKKLATVSGGEFCPACAEKKAREEAVAKAKADTERYLGEVAVAKKKRLELLALREKNRAGRDPHCLDEESQKAEDKYNSQIRKLNRTIQGVDPLA